MHKSWVFGAYIAILVVTYGEASRVGFYEPKAVAAGVREIALSLSPNQQSEICRYLNGTPARNCSEAAGIVYEQCIIASRYDAGWHFIDWKDFVNAFSTFFLPFLILSSQIPLGTRGRSTNMFALALAIGSPLTITFSYCLASLTARRINLVCRDLQDKVLSLTSREARTKYLSTIDSLRTILLETQQIPLSITVGANYDIAQLIVDPENETWWSTIAKEMKRARHHIHLPLVAQFGGVLISIAFAILLFFISAQENYMGLGLGLAIIALWAWLLPLVWIGVQTGNQKSMESFREDLQSVSANLIVNGNHVRQPAEIFKEGTSEEKVTERNISQLLLHGFETEPGLIFGFARIWNRLSLIETFGRAYNTLFDNMLAKKTVHGGDWDPYGSLADNLRATPRRMRLYLLLDLTASPSGIWKDHLVSAVVSVSLQWISTGGAIMVVYNTPAVGVGCHTGSYLLYGLSATLSWLLLVISSVASRSSSISGYKRPREPRFLVIATRWVGSVLAVVNTHWLLFVCTFQLTNGLTTCWCAGSFIQHRSRTWVPVFMTSNDFVRVAGNWWLAGALVSLGSCLVLGLAFPLLARGPRIYKRY